MAKLLTVFILQLLSGIFRLCLLQRTDLRSVSPGENITLHCDITAYYEIWWYHQSSEEMKLLVSAVKGKLNKLFSLNYNVDEHHYDETDNTTTVDLVIIGVTESDLGLYYCGGRDNTTHIQFGKAIKLIFRGGDFKRNRSSVLSNSECSADPAPCRMTAIILVSVLSLSVLMNLIFSWMICYRAQGKHSRDADDSIKQDRDLQYATLRHTAVTRRAAKTSTASDLDSVTYSGIISRPTGH